VLIISVSFPLSLDKYNCRNFSPDKEAGNYILLREFLIRKISLRRLFWLMAIGKIL
jgi:hypothetical protein